MNDKKYGFVLVCTDQVCHKDLLSYIVNLTSLYPQYYIIVIDNDPLSDFKIDDVIQLEKVDVIKNNDLSNDEIEIWHRFLNYIYEHSLTFDLVIFQIFKCKSEPIKEFLPPILALDQYNMISDNKQQKKFIFQILRGLSTDKREKLWALVKNTVFYEIFNPTYIFNDILGVIIYKLRDSLSNIVGIIGDLDDSTENNRILKRSINNILGITNNIIDISDFSNNNLKKELKDFTLPTLLNECIDYIKNDAKIKNLSVTRVIQRDLSNKIFYHDYKKILQILMNIVNNAIKFTMLGRVHLAIEEYRIEDSKLCPFNLDKYQSNYINILFSVKDSGIGMDDEIKKIVNSILNIPCGLNDLQLNNLNLVKKSRIKGLSLYISYYICRFLDGFIWYKSEKDVGSVFYILIPFPII